MITRTVHNTKILPLRWIANLCNHIGTPHLVKMFYMQEDLGITSGFKWKYHGFMWDWTYAIYKKWGTYYKVIDLGDMDMSGKAWDDYDENGVPYWDYDWHEDDEHGSNWRLVK